MLLSKNYGVISKMMFTVMLASRNFFMDFPCNYNCIACNKCSKARTLLLFMAVNACFRDGIAKTREMDGMHKWVKILRLTANPSVSIKADTTFLLYSYRNQS